MRDQAALGGEWVAVYRGVYGDTTVADHAVPTPARRLRRRPEGCRACSHEWAAWMWDLAPESCCQAELSIKNVGGADDQNSPCTATATSTTQADARKGDPGHQPAADVCRHSGVAEGGSGAADQRRRHRAGQTPRDPRGTDRRAPPAVPAWPARRWNNPMAPTTAIIGAPR